MIDAILLGAVQGLTEFLPVSSSGHLVLGQKYLGIAEHDLLFDLMAHIGTLLAVILVYRQVVGNIAKDVFLSLRSRKYTPGAHLLWLMFVASVPTGIIGVTFKTQFEALFHQVDAVAYCLAITGLILLVQRFFRKSQTDSGSFTNIKIDEAFFYGFPWWKAVLIGLAQSMAIAPGISRSGMTISMALVLGLAGPRAALFSFLIAIPAIVGASLLQLREIVLHETMWSVQLTGLGSALIFGWLGLWSVLKVVKQQRLEFFSLYLWTLSFSVLFL